MDRNNQIPGTDLKVAPLGLGTVNAGLKWNGREASRIYDTFWDLGGNVIDCARVYSDWIPPERGRAERVTGEWLKESGKRQEVVLVTKGGHPNITAVNPNMGGEQSKPCRYGDGSGTFIKSIEYGLY